jgi:hypothetical protein
VYKCVSKSFRTGRLELEPQTVQLSAIRCSCIAILWVSLVGFAAINLCVASQRVFVFVNFVIDLVRKLLYTPLFSSHDFNLSSTFFKLLIPVIHLGPWKRFIMELCSESLQNLSKFHFPLLRNITIMQCATHEGNTWEFIFIISNICQVGKQRYVITVITIPSLTTSEVILFHAGICALEKRKSYLYLNCLVPISNKWSLLTYSFI